jgi:hypothetical protein
MSALAQTSLSTEERALVERFVEELRVRLDGQLHGVWLFGSRARGEMPSAESDVDVLVLVLVLVDDASWDGGCSCARCWTMPRASFAWTP